MGEKHKLWVNTVSLPNMRKIVQALPIHTFNANQRVYEKTEHYRTQHNSELSILGIGRPTTEVASWSWLVRLKNIAKIRPTST
jgi:hypothetical protein